MNKEKWIEDLYAENSERIYRIAKHLLAQYLGHAEDAQDVVQEVFLLASRSEEIMKHPKPAAWLAVTTKNVCSNFVRTAVRAGRKQDKAGRALAKKNVHSVHSYVEPSQDNTGVSDVMLTLKQSLTPEEYKLLEAYCIEQRSVEEIAGLMGLKPNAMRVKIWRLRQKTKKVFQEV
ncbi:MAG: sigma-70 family RNA polymerase sigma factor [Clostridia bacterium]|nr:sigma-70 family RNA polymerase sigma factor [Clostridia bacterium]